jgi:hypothetical protein
MDFDLELSEKRFERVQVALHEQPDEIGLRLVWHGRLPVLLRLSSKGSIAGVDRFRCAATGIRANELDIRRLDGRCAYASQRDEHRARVRLRRPACGGEPVGFPGCRQERCSSKEEAWQEITL